MVAAAAFEIPDEAIQLEFVRASGPGGQNVNKVATAVQLRVDLGRAGLPQEVYRRLVRLVGKRMTQDGVLVIEAKRYRTQAQNREDALAQLAALVRRASIPVKTRRKTRPTAASKEERLDSKRRRSRIKRLREDANRGESW